MATVTVKLMAAGPITLTALDGDSVALSGKGLLFEIDDKFLFLYDRTKVTLINGVVEAPASPATPSDYVYRSDLKQVAFSGNYTDLLGLPTISAAGSSGNYSDLVGVPTKLSDFENTLGLHTVATSGNYMDLGNRPIIPGALSQLTNDLNFAPVAFSGHYSDLTGAPIFNLAQVAVTGSYNDLDNRPTISTVGTTGAYSDLIDAPVFETVATSGSYMDLKQRPELSALAISAQWSDINGVPTFAPIAFSGRYSELDGVPTFSEVATTGQYSDVLGTPNLAPVATSGSYADLEGVPTALSQFTNDLSATVVASHVYEVAANGTTGGVGIPFSSIDAALAFASDHHPAQDAVTIRVRPGTYAGFTFTRPNTAIIGDSSLSVTVGAITSVLDVNGFIELVEISSGSIGISGTGTVNIQLRDVTCSDLTINLPSVCGMNSVKAGAVAVNGCQLAVVNSGFTSLQVNASPFSVRNSVLNSATTALVSTSSSGAIINSQIQGVTGASLDLNSSLTLVNNIVNVSDTVVITGTSAGAVLYHSANVYLAHNNVDANIAQNMVALTSALV